MRKLIVLVGIVVACQISGYAFAATEPSLKDKFRELVTKYFGEDFGARLFGPQSDKKTQLMFPEIPKVIKKTTNVQNYIKKTKDPTEFDRLPADRKKQFDYKFIEELFEVTRKSPPKDEDLVNWLNILEQGGSREGIYQALVLDEVYASLEALEGEVSSRTIDFCLLFSERFLQQTFQRTSVNKLNIYSLKRVFTEKGLDLMDYYEVTDLDSLYRWYAFFSSHLANNFGEIMKSEIRREKSPEFHYQWAKKMPIQHIKSEFIIKLHTTMNSL